MNKSSTHTLQTSKEYPNPYINSIYKLTCTHSPPFPYPHATVHPHPNSCLEKKQVAVRWSSNCVQVGFFSWIISYFPRTHLLKKVPLYECRRHPTFGIMEYIHSMLEPFRDPDISHTLSNHDFSVVSKIIWDTTVWQNHPPGKYTNNFHRRENE